MQRFDWSFFLRGGGTGDAVISVGVWNGGYPYGARATTVGA